MTVDTSDIPEADESWFKRARLRWPAEMTDSQRLATAIKIGEDLCSKLIDANCEILRLRTAVLDALDLMTAGRTHDAKMRLEEEIRGERRK